MRTAMLIVIAFLAAKWETQGNRIQLADDKIVGGSEVKDIREMPYIIAISQIERNCTVDSNGKRMCGDKWFYTCGGSLLSSHYVITACHCMADFEITTKDRQAAVPMRRPNGLPVRTEEWRYVAGSRSIDPLERTAQIRVPSWLHWHPQCAREENSAISDLGIAKMQKPYDINEFVQPVKLFSSEQQEFQADFDSMLQHNPYCQVSGWGSTGQESLDRRNNLPTLSGDGTNMAIILKTAKMDVLTEHMCLRKFVDWSGKASDQVPLNFKKLNQICIWSPVGKEGFCSGDSGGPFVCNGYFIALVSNSVECGTSLPQVCQMVTSSFDWIRRDFCNKSDCSDMFYNLEPLKNGKQPTSASSKNKEHGGARGVHDSELSPNITVIVLIYICFNRMIG